jgi:hypothetical protein
MSKHEIDDDVNCVMMASENDQLFLGETSFYKHPSTLPILKKKIIFDVGGIFV